VEGVTVARVEAQVGSWETCQPSTGQGRPRQETWATSVPSPQRGKPMSAKSKYNPPCAARPVSWWPWQAVAGEGTWEGQLGGTKQMLGRCCGLFKGPRGQAHKAHLVPGSRSAQSRDC
jgi:hypothetical protein